MHDMEVSTTRGVDDLHTFMLEGGWFGELISSCSGCKPMDREQRQSAFDDLYGAIDLPAPKLLIFDSQDIDDSLYNDLIWQEDVHN